MLVDLNDFKRVNDVWGHAAGDTVLCAVARADAAMYKDKRRQQLAAASLT